MYTFGDDPQTILYINVIHKSYHTCDVVSILFSDYKHLGSLVVQCLRLYNDLGSIPAQGAKIPQTMWHSQKEKKKIYIYIYIHIYVHLCLNLHMA